MYEPPVHFVEGILELGYVNGVIRIGFGAAPSVEAEEGQQPTPQVSTKLALTPQAFAGCLGPLRELVEKLVEQGVLKPESDAAGTANGKEIEDAQVEMSE